MALEAATADERRSRGELSRPLTGDPIRIAFVLHVMQVAGAEVLVAEIIRRLGRRLAPVVLCLDGIGELGHRLLAGGVDVVNLGRRPGFDLAVPRRMARELGERRIEVVHAHQYSPFFYSALGRVMTRQSLHLMFTEHGRHYPNVVSRKRRWVNKLVLRRLADDLTGVCAFSADSMAEVDGFDRRRIDIVPNGVDLPPNPRDEPVGVRRARLGLAAGRQYVICVARFHPVKDHQMLLRAFGIVAASRPDTDLLLVGDGPLRDDLEREVKASGLESRVHFLGVRDDVPALLAAADVFALTSVSEAASLTLLQAMGAGRPVVVTDVGGNREIVEPGTHGFVVPRGDFAGAARALLQLLSDPVQAEKIGAAGRRRVELQYQLDQTIDNYYGRYARAAARIRNVS